MQNYFDFGLVIWLLAELQPAPDGPARTGLFQPIMQEDGQARRESLARLAELHGKHGNKVKVFCAHDQTEFEDLVENDLTWLGRNDESL
jgi:hypothetical protein